MIQKYVWPAVVASALIVGVAGCSSTSTANLNSDLGATVVPVQDADIKGKYTTDVEITNQPNNAANGPVITIGATAKVTPVVSGEVKEIVMTAKNWEFEPGTITVKKGTKLRLKITSVDVMHGFALPDFNVKVYLTPGSTQTVEFTADKTGTFTFYCSVFCGEGHREMKGTLIVE